MDCVIVCDYNMKIMAEGLKKKGKVAGYKIFSRT
jgi:hypothetical protein